MSKEKKVLRDEEATDLHWFMLEIFCKQLFGDRYELKQPAPAPTENKKPLR